MGTTNGAIVLADLFLFQVCGVLVGHTRSITALASSAQTSDTDTILVSAQGGGEIRVWNVATKTCLRVLCERRGTVCALTQFGAFTFIGGHDTRLSVMRTEAPESSTFTAESECAHTGAIFVLVQCGQRVYSGGGDGLIIAWSCDTLPTVHVHRRLQGHNGAVLALCVDDQGLYSGGQDGTIRLWDLETMYATRVLDSPHVGDVMTLNVHKDFLFSGGSDGTIVVWKRQKCRQLGVLPVGCDLEDESTFTMSTSGSEMRRQRSTTTKGEAAAVLAVLCIDGMLVTSTAEACARKPAVQVWSCTDLRDASTLRPEQASLQRRDSILQDMKLLESQERQGSALLLKILREFVAIKSISGDESLRDECWRAAKFLRSVFDSMGLDVQLLDTGATTNPIVVARTPKVSGESAKRPCITFYGHYDVVSADAADWSSEPFEMIGRDGNLYGRGVADNKGPVLAMLFAVKALMELRDRPVDVVMLIEGEEECKSGGFLPALKRHKQAWLSDTDVLVVSNNYWLNDTKPCLTYGLRGLIVLELHIQGAAHDLHSGMEGGLVSEPMLDLSAILGSLRADSEGKVPIRGFYDNISELSKEEEQLYDTIDFDLDEYRRACGVERLASPSLDERATLMRRWREPCLSVHGVQQSGRPSTSTIPAHCHATLSVRFVPNQKSKDLIECISAHVNEQVRALGTANKVEIRVMRTGDYWLGDWTSRHFKVAAKATKHVWGVEPSFIREGGTIPITSKLARELNTPALIVPIGQASDNAHLKDEKMRVENLLRGAKLFEQFLCTYNE